MTAITTKPIRKDGIDWCSGWRGECINAHAEGPEMCQHACCADDMSGPVVCPASFEYIAAELRETKAELERVKAVSGKRAELLRNRILELAHVNVAFDDGCLVPQLRGEWVGADIGPLPEVLKGNGDA